MRRLYFYIEPDVYEEIKVIALYEGLEISATIRQLIAIALRAYKFRRGTLNPALPQNTKTFFCQVCGQMNSVRRQHTATVLNEEYKFCEDCFFADKYKSFVITLINRA